MNIIELKACIINSSEIPNGIEEHLAGQEDFEDVELCIKGYFIETLRNSIDPEHNEDITNETIRLRMEDFIEKVKHYEMIFTLDIETPIMLWLKELKDEKK